MNLSANVSTGFIQVTCKEYWQNQCLCPILRAEADNEQTRIAIISCEISPTRCNNCVLFFAMALLYMLRATFSPIIRGTYAVYGHR